jgi:hypothetical protein
MLAGDPKTTRGLLVPEVHVHRPHVGPADQVGAWEKPIFLVRNLTVQLDKARGDGSSAAHWSWSFQFDHFS